jgi:hypothetical protein
MFWHFRADANPKAVTSAVAKAKERMSKRVMQQDTGGL